MVNLDSRDVRKHLKVAAVDSEIVAQFTVVVNPVGAANGHLSFVSVDYTVAWFKLWLQDSSVYDAVISSVAALK